MANFRIGLLLPGIVAIGKMLEANRNVLYRITHKTYDPGGDCNTVN
jgi:hypothetical protein